MLNNSFRQFNLNDFFIEKLSQRKILEPTKIQLEVIPKILEEEDVIAQSKTGTGKTIAYLLPLLHLIVNAATTNVSLE